MSPSRNIPPTPIPRSFMPNALNHCPMRVGVMRMTNVKATR